MDEEFRFLLLDFGYPMESSTIRSVINSLENTLTLGISFPGYSKNTHFGISILNSDFTILQSESYLRTNYVKLIKSIDNLLETMELSCKVTLVKYQHFLYNSIEMILRAAQGKFELQNSWAQSKCLKIKVALVTQKTALTLADILTSVLKKLPENFTIAKSKLNYKIVQILSEPEEKTFGISEECTFVKWMTCFDNGSDLNYIFKDWFLNRQEKIKILLSKDINLTLQCEVDSFIFSPISISDRYDLSSEFYFKTSVKNSALGVLKPVHELEIINRIRVRNFCRTLIFGIPRRIRATWDESNWVESHTNLKLFRELCRELHQTKEGLLTKSVAKTAMGELIIFYFLTSDGQKLLLNDVTPDELYLPKRVKLPRPDPKNDESAASLIRNCIQKIEFLDEYSPINYSSGLYQYLKHHLMQHNPSKNFPQNFDKSANSFGKKGRKKKSFAVKNNSKDDNKKNQKNSRQQKQRQSNKKPKLNAEEELRNTHPALLSSEVVKKYRKVPAGVFNLLELGEDYIDSSK